MTLLDLLCAVLAASYVCGVIVRVKFYKNFGKTNPWIHKGLIWTMIFLWPIFWAVYLFIRHLSSPEQS